MCETNRVDSNRCEERQDRQVRPREGDQHRLLPEQSARSIARSLGRCETQTRDMARAIVHHNPESFDADGSQLAWARPDIHVPTMAEARLVRTLDLDGAETGQPAAETSGAASRGRQSLAESGGQAVSRTTMPEEARPAVRGPHIELGFDDERRQDFVRGELMEMGEPRDGGRLRLGYIDGRASDRDMTAQAGFLRFEVGSEDGSGRAVVEGMAGRANLSLRSPDSDEGLGVDAGITLVGAEYQGRWSTGSVTLGASLGVGGGGRLYSADEDGDGQREHCFRLDVGPGTFGLCLEEGEGRQVLRL